MLPSRRVAGNVRLEQPLLYLALPASLQLHKITYIEKPRANKTPGNQDSLVAGSGVHVSPYSSDRFHQMSQSLERALKRPRLIEVFRASSP
jgi:hypothetical protein